MSTQKVWTHSFMIMRQVIVVFTNKEIYKIAMEQSAIDSNCKWEDFLKKDNVVVISAANPAARRYLKLPHVCDLTTYGNNIVATISEE